METKKKSYFQPLQTSLYRHHTMELKHYSENVICINKVNNKYSEKSTSFFKIVSLISNKNLRFFSMLFVSKTFFYNHMGVLIIGFTTGIQDSLCIT